MTPFLHSIEPFFLDIGPSVSTIYDTSLLIHLFPILALVSSVLVVTAKNPVISILWLISVFVNSALYLIYLGVSFIALAYLIVYCGAIAILFLFVVMMINIKLADLVDSNQEFYQNLPLVSIIASTIVFFVFTTFTSLAPSEGLGGTDKFLNSLHLSYVDLGTASTSTQALGNGGVIYQSTDLFKIVDFTQISTLGHSLYTDNAILLIITGFILLLAMISPIVLSSTYRNKNQ